MPTVTLNEMDARAFVTAFNAIAEIADYNFDDESEYRLAIANLVGVLKEQFPPDRRELLGITPRFDLAALLAEKYLDWDTACSAGAVCQSAGDLVGEYLDKSGCDRRQFTGGGDAGRAVAQLRALLTADSSAAWRRYELTLCAATRQEIKALKLSDMLEPLVVADQGVKPANSFWERWTQR
jgi:hypothetical protein